VKGGARPSHTANKAGIQNRLEFATVARPCIVPLEQGQGRYPPGNRIHRFVVLFVVAECNLNLLDRTNPLRARVLE